MKDVDWTEPLTVAEKQQIKDETVELALIKCYRVALEKIASCKCQSGLRECRCVTCIAREALASSDRCTEKE